MGVVLLAIANSAKAADACPVPLGAIVSIEGEVEIRPDPRASWQAARLNAPLCPGAMVRVGDRSRATASLPDAPTYRIDQNTTFRLVRTPAKPEQSALVELLKGALYAFSRRPRKLEMDTPFVDAAVEGTEFLVRVEQTRTTITVFDGTDVARNAYGQARVTIGQAATAEAGQAPVARNIVRPRDAVEWALYYPPILTGLADPKALTPGLPEPIREAARRASRSDLRGGLDLLDAAPGAERGASFHLHRAALLLSVGRVDEARADIDRALAQDPEASLGYALRAVIAVAQNKNERALLDGRRAVELNPQLAPARIALSYAHKRASIWRALATACSRRSRPSRTMRSPGRDCPSCG